MATILITPGLTGDAFRYLEEKLDGRHDLVRLIEDGSSPHDVAGAEILIWCEWSNKTIPPMLEASPSLRWIHACTGGADQLWHPKLVDRDITLTRSPSAASIPVAEWALAAMFTFGKRFGQFEEAQADRSWSPADPIEFLGATVAIVGTGVIGSSIAELANGFGMETIGVNRTGAQVPGFNRVVQVAALTGIMHESDFVVLACPLTPETRGLIGAAEMTAMKPTAFLINVARGPVVNQADLVAAVGAGDIAGAFLDVFDQEPLPPTSPLWNTPGIRISPHSAWRSARSHVRAIDDFLQNLSRFEAGLPVDAVEAPRVRVVP